jgi:hypothetical protein
MKMLALAMALLVQDQVDNPEFKGWTGFKPGSTVTHKISGQGAEGVEQKSTLKSIGDSEVVLELVRSMGGRQVGEPLERKVPAKVPADKAPKEIKKGDDEIEIAGKKLKCTTMEFETITGNGKTFHMKVWAHDEIPGKSARVDVSAEGFKSSMVATAWEKK